MVWTGPRGAHYDFSVLGSARAQDTVDNHEAAYAMEDLLREFASHIALAAELICVLCIAIGSAIAVFNVAKALTRRQGSDPRIRRTIFVGFAGWIILALEFALAADIVRTAIAPTWDQIGQLAAIAAIRTALNYFLEKDVESREPVA